MKVIGKESRGGETVEWRSSTYNEAHLDISVSDGFTQDVLRLGVMVPDLLIRVAMLSTYKTHEGVVHSNTTTSVRV